MDERSDKQKEQGIAYWKANLKLIAILLAIWVFVSYVMGIILVPALENVYIGNLQLGFWFAHQGAMFTFMVLILVYALTMDKLDQQHDVNE